MDRMAAALGTLILYGTLVVAGASSVHASAVTVGTTGPLPMAAPLHRVLIAVPDSGARASVLSPTALATRLRLADPAAMPVVIFPGDPDRAIGDFVISVEAPAAPSGSAGRVRVRIGGADGFEALLLPVAPDPEGPPRVSVVEVLGDATGVVAHRRGLLELAPDELRLPLWSLPGRGADAVALDGAWWTLGPTLQATEAADPAAFDSLRARLAQDPPSAMRRLVDVSVGDVTGDGVPDIALSFRRPYRRTLLNASLPRRSWTDAQGLSAHVGLYHPGDLSEIWVAGTLVRPVRRLAACSGALAVAYSTLRRSTIVATSAWRWQGFAFLPLPELPGRGTPSCIDIDRDGRPEAAVIGRR